MSQTWTSTRCVSSPRGWTRPAGAGQPMPEAMTVASATSDAISSARLVVLRGLQLGLVFFTDCESDKGAELAANQRAAAVLHWLVPAHRQVRVAGPVERVGEDEADEYWSTRAPAVRPSAAASHQSRVVAGGRSWKCRSRTGCGVTLAEPMFPVRDAGPASGCCPPASSSGRNRRTACTTGPLPLGKRWLDHRAAVAVTRSPAEACSVFRQSHRPAAGRSGRITLRSARQLRLSEAKPNPHLSGDCAPRSCRRQSRNVSRIVPRSMPPNTRPPGPPASPGGSGCGQLGRVTATGGRWRSR
jgi:Pyridoxamine 5'-phosphate oxidase